MEFVNGVFAEMKRTGAGQEIYDKWVGQYAGEQQDPPTMTVDKAVELTR